MAFFKNKAENDTPTSHDIEISIYGVKIKVALKVDQEEISKRMNRSNDEGSCERNPNSDEIKIKVDGFLNNYGGSIPRNVFDDMQDAQLGGFKNFLVLKSDFKK